MTTTKGYIVVNETQGEATTLLLKSNSCWKNVPSGGVLLICHREVTVFPSRGTAMTAIRRTRKYLADRNEEYALRRLVPPPSTQKHEPHAQ